MSCTASCSKMSAARLRSSVLICASYSLPPPMAFSKMAGLEVTPRTPSSSIRRFSSPELISPRRMLSYQTDCPSFWSSTSGFGIGSPHELFNRLHDGLAADTGGIEQLLRFARSWHIPNRKSSQRRRYCPSLVSQRLQHRVADAALGPVVLNRHQPPTGFLNAAPQRLAVHRLDRVQVHDADADAFALELVVGLQRLVQGDARADHGALVLGGAAHHFQAADRELVVRLVDDGRLLASGPQEADAGVVGHFLHQMRRLVGVARIEDGAAPYGAHHGQVLQRHLGGAIFANGHARM